MCFGLPRVYKYPTTAKLWQNRRHNFLDKKRVWDYSFFINKEAELKFYGQNDDDF